MHIPAFLLRSGRSWNEISGYVRERFIWKGDEAFENMDVLDSSDYSLQNGRTFVISAHHFVRLQLTGLSAKTADQYRFPWSQRNTPAERIQEETARLVSQP